MNGARQQAPFSFSNVRAGDRRSRYHACHIPQREGRGLGLRDVDVRIRSDEANRRLAALPHLDARVQVKPYELEDSLNSLARVNEYETPIAVAFSRMGKDRF